MFNAPIRMEPSHGVYFINVIGVLRQVLDVSVDLHCIGVVCFLRPAEGTEFARQHAYICLVNVYIAVEKGHVVKSGGSYFIGKSTDFIQVWMTVETKTIFKTELFSNGQLPNNIGQPCVPCMLLERCSETLAPIFMTASHTSC